MARKTKRPRTTGPAAASETDPQTIADAETVQGEKTEDAEIVAGRDGPTEPDDTTPADDAASEGVAPAGTVPEGTDTPDRPVQTPEEGPTKGGSAEPVDPAETSTADETARETLDLPEGVAPTEVPPTTAQTMGDETVPPENEEDLADLARMDGVDPAEANADGHEKMREEKTVDDDARADYAAPVTPPAETAAQPQVIEQRGSGFVPLLLGGLVAGAIGYAIPTFFAPTGESVDPAAFAALEARIDALPAGDGPDLSSVEARQAEMSERLDALAARIDTLESRPSSAAAQSAGASTATPSGDAEALAALRADVDALSGVGADLGALSARVDALAATVEDLPAPAPDMTDRVAALEAELAALGAETQAVEISAEERAREAAANQIRIAVDSGVPYAEPLSVVGGDVPPVLAENAEAGLPTDAALAAAFPEAARVALAEARRNAPDEGGLSAFIRRQTGARSLEPREGDDPDAVLSRAEAAIRSGDVDAALAEVEALPAEAQDAMAGWIADARTRSAARAALSDYLGTE